MGSHRVIGVGLLGLILVVAWTVAGTARAQNASWLSSPPGASGASATCPSAGQWLLLYWGGAPVGIATAAAACPGADFFWSRQGDRWLGFAPAAPAASDTWSTQTGEATFVHGLSSGTPVPVSGTATAPAGTGSPSPTITATATVPAIATSTGTATSTPLPTATLTVTPTATSTVTGASAPSVPSPTPTTAPPTLPPAFFDQGFPPPPTPLPGS